MHGATAHPLPCRTQVQEWVGLREAVGPCSEWGGNPEASISPAVQLCVSPCEPSPNFANASSLLSTFFNKRRQAAHDCIQSVPDAALLSPPTSSSRPLILCVGRHWQGWRLLSGNSGLFQTLILLLNFTRPLCSYVNCSL